MPKSIKIASKAHNKVPSIVIQAFFALIWTNQ